MTNPRKRLNQWILGGAGALAAIAAVSRGLCADASDPLLDMLIKKGILTEQEAKDIKTEADTNAVPISASKWKLSDSIKSIGLFGDVRFRYEYRGADNPTALAQSTSDTYRRERFRYAFRAGIRGDLFDDFNYGVRIETSSSARSSWVTFGDDNTTPSTPTPSPRSTTPSRSTPPPRPGIRGPCLSPGAPPATTRSRPFRSAADRPVRRASFGPPGQQRGNPGQRGGIGRRRHLLRRPPPRRRRAAGFPPRRPSRAGSCSPATARRFGPRAIGGVIAASATCSVKCRISASGWRSSRRISAAASGWKRPSSRRPCGRSAPTKPGPPDRRRG